MSTMQYNGMDVMLIVEALYNVADFRGHYVDVAAPDEQTAVDRFVANRTCHRDTPVEVADAWRAAGCPTREVWEASQAFVG